MCFNSLRIRNSEALNDVDRTPWEIYVRVRAEGSRGRAWACVGVCAGLRVHDADPDGRKYFRSHVMYVARRKWLMRSGIGEYNAAVTGDLLIKVRRERRFLQF